MYGLVNQAVKDLLIEGHGKAVWDQIRTEAGAPEEYSPLQPYDDAITYDLVGTASRVLGQPAEALLFQFGVIWVERIATTHYAEMISTSGNTFTSFLQNLDLMHERMRVTFPGYRPPSFRVVELDGSRLLVDYYSIRQGLLPLVEGLLHGLAAHFGQEVELEHIPDDTHGLPCKRIQVTYRPRTP